MSETARPLAEKAVVEPEPMPGLTIWEPERPVDASSLLVEGAIIQQT